MSSLHHSRLEAQRDALVLRRCEACAKLYPPQIVTCGFCGATDLRRSESSGAGCIVSSKRTLRPQGGSGGDMVPFTIAIVELDEGPLVYTSIEGHIPASLGEPVRVEFVTAFPDERFPVFRVCSTPQARFLRRSA